jgi:triosephosphate isomerase
MPRRPLIAGNWKMNGLKADGVALAAGIAAKLKAEPPRGDLLICPPATLVDAVAQAVAGSGLAVGGQDCHADKSGAHTGDVAAAMLVDLGATYVIVGHSERRADHGETDAIVRAKAAAAHAAGLVAIICIGETQAQRTEGLTIKVVGEQFLGSLPEGATAENTVIAYEPVWAIGTGLTATTADVIEVHGSIRALATDIMSAEVAGKLRILYGGSMKPSNAKELLALDDVDGGLIGGAALKVKDFWAIAQSCP